MRLKVKAFRELTLADRFIFFKVMQNKELYDAKGIRLDIYVKDKKATVYNVEMQTVHTSNLPQRSRYYQNLIDVDLLGRGADYRQLNRSFVIFICMEDSELVLGDGTVKIFLNPYSDMDDVTSELGNFLRYLAEGVAVDEYTRKLVEAVDTAKRDPRLMVEYMSYYAEQADRKAEREDGRAEGLEKGLAAFVETLKTILPDFETVYAAVVGNEAYAECSREKIRKYYENAKRES